MASYIDIIEQYEKEIIAKKDRIDELEIVMQKILSKTTSNKIKNWITALFPANETRTQLLNYTRTNKMYSM